MRTAVSVVCILLLAGGALSAPVQAQSWRVGGTFYGKVGVGLSKYMGDASPSATPYSLGHFGETSGFPYVARGEIGYQILPQLAVGVGFESGNYPFTDPSGRLGTTRTAAQLLARYTMGAETWRAAPYVDVGRVLSFGGVRGGHGMSVGLGVDVAMTKRLSLNVEARRNLLWPDNAVDDRGIGIKGIDQMSQLLGVGVKFSLKESLVPPRVLMLDGPRRVEVGDSVAYTARVNETASAPLTRRWIVGADTVGTTMTMRRAFKAPGTRTVAFAARNEAGRDRDTMTVMVEPPPPPARIAGIAAQPNPARTGLPVKFTSEVTGATPRTYVWRFGDQASANGEAPTHIYDASGTYTVQLQVSNETGRDTATTTVRVRWRRRVLGNVHFATDRSTIKEKFEVTLKETLKVIKSRMAKAHFVIEGHTDNRGSDAYNKRLSERRAEAVVDWLVAHGVSPDRLTARGMGEERPIAPNDTPEGRRENRRTEIVVRGDGE